MTWASAGRLAPRVGGGERDALPGRGRWACGPEASSAGRTSLAIGFHTLTDRAAGRQVEAVPRRSAGATRSRTGGQRDRLSARPDDPSELRLASTRVLGRPGPWPR